MNVTSFLEELTRWAVGRADILAVALVGSHARGQARPDSDLDLVILCEDPESWLAGEWPSRFGEIVSSAVERYGALTSRRVHYVAGLEVEFGFAHPDWARLPLDAGTRVVLAAGARVLWDRAGILEAARRAAVS